ncbi:MAG: glycosyltransferase family 39 protein [Chloroflexota bacterium]
MQGKRILDAICCLIISLYIVMGIQLVPLHGDESTLIFMGRDFHYHMQGDTDRIFVADWDTLNGDEATEQQLRLINGTLSKYLYGMVAYVSGYSLDDINDQWAWSLGWDWNHENGHVPSDDLLLISRYTSASLLILSAIAFYGLGVSIGGRGVALIASAYYVLNPAILMNGRRAIMESGMLAFTILAVWMALLALRHRHFGWYIALGLVSGLAVASKHTSVVTIAIVFGVSGLYLLSQRQNLLKLIGAGVLSLIVFFGLNPAWWLNPVQATRTVLELRQDLLAGQVEFFGGYESTQAQVVGFARQTFVVPPMYAETDLDGFLSQQTDAIARYQASPFHGISLGGTWIGGIILAGFVILGLGWLWRDEDYDRASRWLITAWLLAMVLLTLALTPLEWQRYYIPIYPVIGLLGAIGLYASTIHAKLWITTHRN